MDFLRFDTKHYGPVYVRSENVMSIVKIDEATCNVGVLYPNGRSVEIEMAADADEVAQSIERVLPGCRIHRVI